MTDTVDMFDPARRRELIRYVGRRVADKNAVEDVVQKTFLQVHQWLAHGHAPEEPMAFLYTTARNVILHERRHRMAAATTTVEDVDLFVADAPPIEQQIASEEEREWLYAALDALPKQYREAIILSRIYQYSRDETASRMGGISVNSVKTYVRRGIAQLRAECGVDRAR